MNIVCLSHIQIEEEMAKRRKSRLKLRRERIIYFGITIICIGFAFILQIANRFPLDEYIFLIVVIILLLIGVLVFIAKKV